MKDKVSLAEKVYRTLRNDLNSGMYLPGERIEAGVVAMRLNTSVSPIRAALNRFVGERLVDFHPHEGYSIPPLNEAALREQFEWNHQLAMLALRWPTTYRPPALPGREDEHGLVGGIERLIVQIGRRAPSSDLRAELSASNIRLRAARTIEVELIPTIESDLKTWQRTLAGDDVETMAHLLQRKHDRRQALVPQITERLNQALSQDR